MSEKSRYPGAQPFSDDAFSRRVFFGRKEDSHRLADKIVANRTVVVYGRSGLGKTSLLNAGVAPLLREEGYLPLFVRVNNTDKGLLHAVLEGVPTEASRQEVEYIPGQTGSLWSFFKTAEFWRGDLLLTPVLVLDQFEELFTLQDEDARESFLDELSYLIRGVRPSELESSAPHDELSERPPMVQIVFSLREDYLGFLEEAADKIPQIFDSRFRLAPLSPEAAKAAILEPARIEDHTLNTRPFALDNETMNGILDFLSQRRTSVVANSKLYVEPFQLQLVCRYLEQIAKKKQQKSASTTIITMKEIGGHAGLTKTLKDFYGNAIQNLTGRQAQKASRRLCEEYLISGEGRRLSLEENEIRQQFGLSKQALGKLVSSRLLRTENRSESIYYELSHDTLVIPILASQQKKTQFTGWLGIVSGSLIFSFAGFLTLAILVVVLEEIDTTTFSSNLAELSGQILLILLLVISLITIFIISLSMLRNSARALLRHRRARDADKIGLVTELPRKTKLIHALLWFGSGISILGIGLLTLFSALLLISVPFSQGFHQLFETLELSGYRNEILEQGVGLDLIAFVIGSVAILLAGGHLIYKGIFKTVRYPAHQTPEMSTEESFNSGKERLLKPRKYLAIVFFIAALVLFIITLLTIQCVYITPGLLHDWMFLDWFSLIKYQCSVEYKDSHLVDIFGNIGLIFACIFVAVRMLSGKTTKSGDLE